MGDYKDKNVEVSGIDKIPLLRYFKHPVSNLSELYRRYQMGGEFGWYTFVYDLKTFAYWDIELKNWRVITGAGGLEQMPYIGSNKNWWLGDVDTGWKAVFEFTDLTEDEVDILRQPALDAAVIAGTATDRANISADKADAARQSTEAATSNANTATSNANIATGRANTATSNANTAASNANTAAEGATLAKDSANTAANLANNKASLAADKAALANTAAGSANNAATNANAKATLANTATSQANTARDRANISADKADAARQSTETATSNASTATSNANTATGKANTATANANTARDYATAQADYAKTQGDYAKAEAENIPAMVADKSGHEEEKTVARALSELNAKIKALEAVVANKTVERLTVASKFELYGDTNLILIGEGAPAVTPDFIGQRYIDTVGRVAYTAFNTSNAGGWA